ncbi:hypothetical protein BB560_005596, partial [Smittium megazygosporum]
VLMVQSTTDTFPLKNSDENGESKVRKLAEVLSRRMKGESKKEEIEKMLAQVIQESFAQKIVDLEQDDFLGENTYSKVIEMLEKEFNCLIEIKKSEEEKDQADLPSKVKIIEVQERIEKQMKELTLSEVGKGDFVEIKQNEKTNHIGDTNEKEKEKKKSSNNNGNNTSIKQESIETSKSTSSPVPKIIGEHPFDASDTGIVHLQISNVKMFL